MDPTEYSDIDLAPVDNTELEWVYAHLDELQQRYGGQWIAVLHDKVIAHHEDLVEVGKLVKAKGLNDLYYDFIPAIGEEPPPLVL